MGVAQMLSERIAAATTGGGAFAGASLMGVLSHFGVEWPPIVWIVWGCFCALLAVVCLCLTAHMTWAWLRSRGLQLGPAIVIAVGLLIALGGVVWGAYTWKIPIPRTVGESAEIAPAARKFPALGRPPHSPTETAAAEVGDAAGQGSAGAHGGKGGGAASPMGDIVNNKGIVTQGQTGGTNTIVNQAPEPDLELMSSTQRANPDGTFTRVIRVRVASPYTPGLLKLLVEAEGILEGDVHPVDTGNILFGRELKSDEYFVSITSPTGRYDVVIKTKGAVTAKVTFGFS